MNQNKPTFQFIEPVAEYTGFIRRIILGYSDLDIEMRLPIRPTGFAYFTYSRYPKDITLHYSNKEIKPISKLGFANQILREHPYFQIKGKFYQIGIELYPHIPYSLFDLKGTQLLNQIHAFPADDSNMANLSATLDALGKPEEVAIAMQDYLWKRLKQVEIRSDIVGMLDDIYERHGEIQVSELAEKNKISTRHMQRLFKDYIGLTPKQYSMIIQFNHVQQKFINGNTHVENYHDQAHFIKICKRITGYTPNELMKMNDGFISGYLK